MSTRPILNENKRTSAASKAISSFHGDFLKTVIGEVDSGGLVVIGMRQNPVCKQVKNVLNQANIKFKYLEYGGYLSEWKPRLAIKLWSGWPTFPQVFVDGVLIGGCKETKAALADGSLARLISKSEK